MSVRTFLLSTIAMTLLSVSAAHAAAGAPVAHSHDGRSHSHPLPATGKNHTHGKKPAPKPKIPASSSVDIWSDYNILRKASDETEVDGWRPTPQGWARITTSETSTYRIKHSSQFREGGYVGVVAQAEQRLHSRDKNVTIFTVKLLIKRSDCIAKIGTIITKDLSGKVLLSASFVENGTSVGDGLGHAVCISHDLWK